MEKNNYFGSMAKQTSVANQEIIIPHKPTDFVGTFKTSQFILFTLQPCRIIINGSKAIAIPNGGIEWNTPIQSLKIVDAGIEFYYQGYYESTDSDYVVSNYNYTPSVQGMIGITTSLPLIYLRDGDTYKINIIGVMRENYSNYFFINPSNCTMEIEDNAIATIDKGIIAHVKKGETYCEITFDKFKTFVKIVCL